MEILPGKGLDIIKFGLTEEEIISQLGKPDKTFYLTASKHMQFFEPQIELSIEEEHDNRLGWIEVHNPEALLFGKKLIDKKKEEVLAVISSQVTDEPEVEDNMFFESWFYEAHWLQLLFEFGRLRQINFGSLWLDDDTPDWP